MPVLIIILLAAILLGGLIGMLLRRDPGYVLVAYDNMAVETNIGLAILILFLAYALIRLAIRLFKSVTGGGQFLSSWNGRRRRRGARTQTVHGLLFMAEGRWQEAKKMLLGAAPRAETPLINYLQAARAADELGETVERDDLLKKAHESTPGSKFAVGLTQAQLQINRKQWEQGLATLLPLYKQVPKHPQVLAMLRDCYDELSDWHQLLELLPALKKADLHDDATQQTLLCRGWLGVITDAEPTEHATAWRKVPKALKADPVLVGTYAQLLSNNKEADAAEDILAAACKKNWDAKLVELYGLLDTSDPARQLMTAEGWLKSRPSDAGLLLTLGRLALRNENWAQAREYFEASLKLEPTSDASGELGRLCCALGDTERGVQHLTHAHAGLPDLPLPSQTVKSDQVAGEDSDVAEQAPAAAPS